MGTTNIYGFHYAESTDPPNGAAQQQRLAEDVEAALSSVDDRLSRPPVAVLSMSANTQQFADGVAQPVQFNAAPIDTHSGWNGSDTYTVQQSGVYQIMGAFTWGAFDNGYRNVKVDVNSVDVLGSQESKLPVKDSSLHVTPISTPTLLVRLSVGDKVQLIAWQTSGQTIAATGNVSSHPEYRPTLQLVKVSD